MAKGDAFGFAMGFVDNSDKYRQQFVDKWNEVVTNFIVNVDYESAPKQKSPYRYGSVYKSSGRNIILKDPETHKLVMTYASKLVRALFADMHHEYVRARPRGYEDAAKAQTTTRLLRYVFGMPGHFRTFVEAIVDMLLFGTSVIEVNWRYEEKEVLARTLGMDWNGPTDTMERVKLPAYDDVCLRNIDPMDFYPDPSRYRLSDMGGCAKRFRMNAAEARRMEIYKQSAVEEAIGKGTQVATAKPESFRRGLDQPGESTAPTEFHEMIGYEYWGDVDSTIELYDQYGKRVDSNRGCITILNGVVVRQDAWPLADYALPFGSLIINPLNGRFYGISPAEVVRWDQSFADAIKILLAEAIIRQVHPPIAFDPDADVDIAALKAWKADAMISARGGPNGVGTLRYDANVSNGFAMLNGLKMGIQEASGALGAIQGDSGPDRESATVGSQRLQFAMDRPELAAMVIENDGLPPIAQMILRRCQQFIHDEADLAKRIGEEPAPLWLGNIMGDFDIEFVGSRMSLNRQQRLQAMQTLVSMAQVMPALQAVLPSVDLAKEVVGDLMEMPDVAAMIGQNPQQIQANLMAMQQFGQGGPGNNGVPTIGQPPGMLPAQAAGGQ